MAKRRIKTEIDINAPAAKVWAVLTDFSNMPLWNPFMTAIAGRPMVGQRLTVTIRPPRQIGHYAAPDTARGSART